MRKKISWLLVVSSFIVIFSGYGLTIFGFSDQSIRFLHFILGGYFAFLFFLHLAISIVLIRFNWKKSLASIYQKKAGNLVRLRFIQRVSGWFLVAFAGLTLLSGLDWFKIGAGRFVPFSTHIWIDLPLWIATIIHISVGLWFALTRRRFKQAKNEIQKPISIPRREAIIYMATAALSILSVTYLDRISLVSRAVDKIKKILPPGQYEVPEMNILHISPMPSFDISTWNLIIDGMVKNPLEFNYEDVLKLPRVKSISDFHCVTGWTKFSNKWEGVSLKTIIKLAEPLANAKYALFLTDQVYTTSLPLDDLTRDDVLLAYRLDDEELPLVHGGPLKLVVPHRYAYKSAKWVRGIKFIEENELGYWEVRGYSDTADPFTNDRFTKRVQ
jgi:DMSO/TMAO reductase YedYZ molybdopterin-dependent catalytic subunit